MTNEEAKKELSKLIFELGFEDNVDDRVCALNMAIKVLEQPKWIPCSERLPEDAQEVLYSTKTGRVFHGEYYDDNTDRKWFSYKDDIFSFNNVVNAWMPLPKPYEPQERSE